MLRLNVHFNNDWSGDLYRCVKIMRSIAGFCLLLALVTLLLTPVYLSVRRANKPREVYTYTDFKLAALNPFVNTIILRADLRLTDADMPARDLLIIRQ
ncbi:MAG: hypothetical protein LBL96_09660 [Clostridiales bacterium]|jgi:hypothetical protein|nr:hypothetical protein [Clostridiales bacterium]